MANSIIGIQRRLAEAGRIRIGDKVEMTRQDGSKTSRPAKLDEFRITSQHKPFLDSLAAVYGGKVTKWDDAPSGQQWELLTKAKSLNVIVPPSDMSFSQSYELWSGGGCSRRCDGVFNSVLQGPCVCDPENRECKPHTRLSVMFAELPGSGMWRLDTQGYYAMSELAGAFELISMVSEATNARLIRATLRLDEREVKRPGEATKKFVVPVLSPEFQSFGMTELAAPTRGLTPIEGGAVSLTDGLASLEAPTVVKPRANAAEVIPPTSIVAGRNRGSVVIDNDTGEIISHGDFGSDSDLTALRSEFDQLKAFIERAEGLTEIFKDEWMKANVPPVNVAGDSIESWTMIVAFARRFKTDAMTGKYDEPAAPNEPDLASEQEDEANDFARGERGAPPRPGNKPLEVSGPAAKSQGQKSTATPNSEITKPQVGKIRAMCANIDQEPHEFCAGILGVEVASLNDLTKGQASKIIDALIDAEAQAR